MGGVWLSYINRNYLDSIIPSWFNIQEEAGERRLREGACGFLHNADISVNKLNPYINAYG